MRVINNSNTIKQMIGGILITMLVAVVFMGGDVWAQTQGKFDNSSHVPNSDGLSFQYAGRTLECLNSVSYVPSHLGAGSGPPIASAGISQAQWEEKYSARMVWCMRVVLEETAINFITEIQDYLRTAMFGAILLAMVIFGIKAVAGMFRNLKAEGLTFLIKIALVMGIFEASDELVTFWFDLTDTILTLTSGVVASGFDGAASGIGALSICSNQFAPPGSADEVRAWLLIWDRFDCFFDRLIGFGVDNLDKGLLAIGLAAIFSGMLGFWVFFLMISMFISIFTMLFNAAATVIFSYGALAMIMIILPLFIPLILFRKFERWVTQQMLGIAVANVIIPGFTISFLFFTMTALDTMLFTGSYTASMTTDDGRHVTQKIGSLGLSHPSQLDAPACQSDPDCKKYTQTIVPIFKSLGVDPTASDAERKQQLQSRIQPNQELVDVKFKADSAFYGWIETHCGIFKKQKPADGGIENEFANSAHLNEEFTDPTRAYNELVGGMANAASEAVKTTLRTMQCAMGWQTAGIATGIQWLGHKLTTSLIPLTVNKLNLNLSTTPGDDHGHNLSSLAISFGALFLFGGAAITFLKRINTAVNNVVSVRLQDFKLKSPRIGDATLSQRIKTGVAYSNARIKQHVKGVKGRNPEAMARRGLGSARAFVSGFSQGFLKTDNEQWQKWGRGSTDYDTDVMGNQVLISRKAVAKKAAKAKEEGEDTENKNAEGEKDENKENQDQASNENKDTTKEDEVKKEEEKTKDSRDRKNEAEGERARAESEADRAAGNATGEAANDTEATESTETQQNRNYVPVGGSSDDDEETGGGASSDEPDDDTPPPTSGGGGGGDQSTSQQRSAGSDDDNGGGGGGSDPNGGAPVAGPSKEEDNEQVAKGDESRTSQQQAMALNELLQSKAPEEEAILRTEDDSVPPDDEERLELEPLKQEASEEKPSESKSSDEASSSEEETLELRPLDENGEPIETLELRDPKEPEKVLAENGESAGEAGAGNGQESAVQAQQEAELKEIQEGLDKIDKDLQKDAETLMGEKPKTESSAGPEEGVGTAEEADEDLQRMKEDRERFEQSKEGALGGAGSEESGASQLKLQALQAASSALAKVQNAGDQADVTARSAMYAAVADVQAAAGSDDPSAIEAALNELARVEHQFDNAASANAGNLSEGLYGGAEEQEPIIERDVSTANEIGASIDTGVPDQSGSQSGSKGRNAEKDNILDSEGDEDSNSNASGERGGGVEKDSTTLRPHSELLSDSASSDKESTDTTSFNKGDSIESKKADMKFHTKKGRLDELNRLLKSGDDSENDDD